MIDRRITGALAWGGLLLVIGVPSADLILRNVSSADAAASVETAAIAEQPAAVARPASKPAPAPAPKAEPKAETAPQTGTDPVVTASARPAAGTGDAVDQFLSKGKKLPDYISGGDTAKTPTPTTTPTAPAEPQPAVPAPAEEAVASLPEPVAPVPMPATMRPKSQALVVETDRQVVSPRPGTPVPPAEVTGADLEDWESGSLADYLARRGLLSGQDGDGVYFVEADRF